MSHVLFNKYFKSDIFNTENVKVIEKPSKQYHPSTLAKTNNDIFNISQKNVFENKIKNRIKKFNTQQHSLYNSKSQSDIFFTKKPIKEENEKVNYNQNRRNLSNRSTVFSHCTEKDEIIKKNKNETNYNPDNYYSNDTSFKRLCKQFYDIDNLNNPKVNVSSRGYILNEVERLNNPIRRVLSPNRKKIPWNEDNSSGVKYINNEDKSGSISKKNRINVQRSNIFFKENNNNIYSDDEIERENYKNKGKSKIERINVNKMDYDKINSNNKNNNNTIMKFKKNEMRNYNINEYGNNEKNGFQTDRTDYNTYKTKWEKNLLDLKNTEKEIIFSKQKDIESRNIPNWQKNQTGLMESAKIYKSKYQLPKTKTENTINYDNRIDLNKIKQVIDSQTDLKEDQKKRFMLNSTTSNLYDKSFYERNMKYKKLQNKEKEHEYILTPEKNKIEKNNLDIFSIKKLMRDEGLHIYDVSSMADNITGTNKEIKFKIRENEGEKYNNHISNIKEQLLNEKGILMEPVKKISVNKKYNPSIENKYFGINQMYLEQNTRKPPKKFYNEKKNKFTNEFNQIDMKYKNRGIKNLGFDN